MENLSKNPPPSRLLALMAFGLTTLVMVPLQMPQWGLLPAALCLGLAFREADRAVARRFGVLLGCVALLGFADVDTNMETRAALTLAGVFLAVVLVPALILGRTDPGVISYRFWPRRLRKLDLFYVAISIPLAWGVLEFWFNFNPWMYRQWTMPLPPDPASVKALFWGINGTGIWDELFFVNTVYAVLRSLFPYRLANFGQAVVYTAVLFDMAFVGIGPIVVYAFALTQGAMFEESENLLWVLVVHLIVDFFLFQQILAGWYPQGVPAGWVLH